MPWKHEQGYGETTLQGSTCFTTVDEVCRIMIIVLEYCVFILLDILYFTCIQHRKNGT